MADPKTTGPKGQAGKPQGSTWAALRRFWPWARPYWKWIGPLGMGPLVIST